ncbi:RNA polymerase subunit sigma-70 [Streptomyces sp. IBSBF 2953]|uniref:RNA polymerase subunit sigma-70 n=1 Tax=Streptomyces TaxID=1883 RepID=UPI00211A1BA0|nr:RNA polymerase subunit sigma-70 [Streptomyces scabiei]MCQ9183139.1 RNA polymerase subunit sigma-70 [Streptomyces hayashii]MDX3118706.1 RNA polymerase subunit sigma-70 [Streptomyces scabiei]
MTASCQACGSPIESAGGPGRVASYCSQACRQRAYRERRRPDGTPVKELVSDIGDRLVRLRLRPELAFHADVEALSTRFAQLRRLAREARQGREESEARQAGAGEARPGDESLAERPPENVTPDAVTNSPRTPPGSRGTPSGEDAFTSLVEGRRRELRVHCYRLLGSYDEAEDLTQETFLRAWRARDTLEDVANVRAWLYRIATHVCLDFLRRHNRRPAPYEPVPGLDSGDGPPPPRLPWLQPFPDDQLPETPAPQLRPDEEAVAGETLELVFLTAVQLLPPRQRAAVILRDVAGWSAQETADLLGSTLASANSAVQRGRSALREALPGRREDWSAATPSAEDLKLVQRYVDAVARADFDAMVDLVREDAVLTMPPNPFWFTSRDALFAFVRPNIDPASPAFFGHWRLMPVRANGQPGVAGYLRRPGTSVFRAQLIDVLRTREGRIAEITTFEPHLFPAFGLPMTL